MKCNCGNDIFYISSYEYEMDLENRRKIKHKLKLYLICDNCHSFTSIELSDEVFKNFDRNNICGIKVRITENMTKIIALK